MSRQRWEQVLWETCLCVFCQFICVYIKSELARLVQSPQPGASVNLSWLAVLLNEPKIGAVHPAERPAACGEVVTPQFSGGFGVNKDTSQPPTLTAFKTPPSDNQETICRCRSPLPAVMDSNSISRRLRKWFHIDFFFFLALHFLRWQQNPTCPLNTVDSSSEGLNAAFSRSPQLRRDSRLRLHSRLGGARPRASPQTCPTRAARRLRGSPQKGQSGSNRQADPKGPFSDCGVWKRNSSLTLVVSKAGVDLIIPANCARQSGSYLRSGVFP